MSYQIGNKVNWLIDYNHPEIGIVKDRIDIITDIVKNVFGDTQYLTKEIVPKGGTREPKIGKAYDSYLVKAEEIGEGGYGVLCAKDKVQKLIKESVSLLEVDNYGRSIEDRPEWKMCSYFRVDSNTCRTGCLINKVSKGNICPFEGNGLECKCSPEFKK